MPGAKKDTAKDADQKKKNTETKKPEPEKPKPLTLPQELKANLDALVKATENRTHGPILRVLRRTNHVRRNLPNADLHRVVEKYVSDDMPFKAALLAGINELTPTEKDAPKDGDTKPEVLGEIVSSGQAGDPHPEVEAYLSNIVINNLLRDSKNDTAADLAAKVLTHFSQFNKRNLDVFTSQTTSFLSLAHQNLGTLSSIRHFLLKAHRSACLQHNEFGQATIINLLLRNYLNDSLYDQASKLVAKVRFPETASVNQYV